MLTPPYTTNQKIVQFVRVHQVLLNILIGKAGLFQTVPFIGEPVAATLRQLESVVDVSSCMYLADAITKFL